MPEKVLITGISGGQGRLLAKRLSEKYKVLGIDRARWGNAPPDITVHAVDIRKRKAEGIFRTERPAAVVHLGQVRHFRLAPEVRHSVNVGGTRRLLECCVKFGVKTVVIVSSSYVYGALPEGSSFVREDAPLDASRNYPEIRDLVEIDTLATTYLWKHPQINTVILRPVNTLGRRVHSAIKGYLRLRYVPMIMGFDPMLQFIHEEDVSEAITLALETGIRGVYNVAGPGEVPLSVAIRETGGTPVPVPELVLVPALYGLFKLGLWDLPPGAALYAKYPCTIDGSAFVADTGFKPLFTLEETLRSIAP